MAQFFPYPQLFSGLPETPILEKPQAHKLCACGFILWSSRAQPPSSKIFSLPAAI